MENPQEVLGTLASGGSYRASSQLLEIRTPTGEVAASFDTRLFNSISRQDRTITIGRLNNSSINVTTSTLQEAEALEQMLGARIAAPVSAPPSSETSLTGNPIFKWGCIGALVVVGLGAICLIAGLLLFRNDDDSNGDASAPSPTVTAAAVATQAPEATEPEPVDDVDPTATEDTSPTMAATIAPSPTSTEVPTATSEPEPTATPEPTPPSGPGMARSNPLPFGELHATGDWDLQVLEVVRGQEALDRLLAANQFNELPPEGYEYVLVNMFARYTGTSTTPQNVDKFWLQSTGDARILHSYASVVEPTPAFQATLLPGGEVTGWATFLARTGESNLMLVWENWEVFEADLIYLALEPGARIDPPAGRLADPNDLGSDRAEPVPFGENLVTETWEIRVLEHVRGQEALDRVMEANQFNTPPEPGMEFVIVRVNARNVGTDPEAAWINSFSFGMTGSSNQIFETAIVVEPDPGLDFQVYPGGEVNGWFTIAVPIEEQNLLLVFEDWLSFFGEPRYMALQ